MLLRIGTRHDPKSSNCFVSGKEIKWHKPTAPKTTIPYLWQSQTLIVGSKNLIKWIDTSVLYESESHQIFENGNQSNYEFK